jgi:hypothetical protein
MILALGVLLGALLLEPAVAHVTDSLRHLTGHLDRRYVRDSGEIRLAVGGSEWQLYEECTLAPCPRIIRYEYGMAVEYSDGSAAEFTLQPHLPTILYGRNLRLKGAELCYDAEYDMPTLSSVKLVVYPSSDADPYGGVSQADVSDTTDRDDATCRLYRLPDPERLTKNSGVGMRMNVAWGAGTNAAFFVGRTTFLLAPAS